MIINKLKKKTIINLYIQCSKNNTRLTLTSQEGGVIYTITPGNLGIKKGARSAPGNAYDLISTLTVKLQELKITRIHNIFFKGLGPGRYQTLRALRKLPCKIRTIKEITSFPFNGCRPKKPRRLKRLN